MNNNVIEKMDNVIYAVKNSDIYKEYIEILNKVNNSSEINKLTKEIKKINKELVLKPSVALESLLKDKEEELNNIPLYIEYKYKLEELNNLLLIIKNKMDKVVQDLVID